MAVSVELTPVLQKAEKCRFYQEIGGCYKGTIILNNSVPIRGIPSKCIFVRLEKALMRGKNEREIPLALYIRLEYRTSLGTSRMAVKPLEFSQLSSWYPDSS